MKKTILVTAAALLMSGCFRSQIVAPSDKNFTLAARGDICQQVESRKVFSLWGLINYGNNTSVSLFDEVPANKRVRLRTKIAFSDYIITAITAGLISSHSIALEVCQ